MVSSSTLYNRKDVSALTFLVLCFLVMVPLIVLLTTTATAITTTTSSKTKQSSASAAAATRPHCHLDTTRREDIPIAEPSPCSDLGLCSSSSTTAQARDHLAFTLWGGPYNIPNRLQVFHLDDDDDDDDDDNDDDDDDDETNKNPTTNHKNHTNPANQVADPFFAQMEDGDNRKYRLNDNIHVTRGGSVVMVHRVVGNESMQVIQVYHASSDDELPIQNTTTTTTTTTPPPALTNTWQQCGQDLEFSDQMSGRPMAVNRDGTLLAIKNDSKTIQFFQLTTGEENSKNNKPEKNDKDGGDNSTNEETSFCTNNKNNNEWVELAPPLTGMWVDRFVMAKDALRIALGFTASSMVQPPTSTVWVYHRHNHGGGGKDRSWWQLEATWHGRLLGTSMALNHDGTVLVLSSDTYNSGVAIMHRRQNAAQECRSNNSDNDDKCWYRHSTIDLGTIMSHSVAISDDGRIVAVGAVLCGVPHKSGCVFVFYRHRQDSTNWILVGKVQGNRKEDMLGTLVALNDQGTLLAAAMALHEHYDSYVKLVDIVGCTSPQDDDGELPVTYVCFLSVAAAAAVAAAVACARLSQARAPKDASHGND